MIEDFLALFNGHTHGVIAHASTTPPNQQATVAAHATEATSAQ